jgi:hypothetical protein
MEAVYEEASEDVRKVLGLVSYDGVGAQATHELLLTTLLVAQAAQIQDLRERVAQLELARR